jgi:hypothetical protein
MGEVSNFYRANVILDSPPPPPKKSICVKSALLGGLTNAACQSIIQEIPHEVCSELSYLSEPSVALETVWVGESEGTAVNVMLLACLRHGLRKPHVLSRRQYTRWFKYDRDWFVCKQVTVCPGHIWTTLYKGQLRQLSSPDGEGRDSRRNVSQLH